MNPYETDPQRHEAPSAGEPSHQPADASHEGNSPQRGESDPTAIQPTVGLPTGPPQSVAPQSGIPQSVAPQSGIPQSVAPQSGIPQSGAAQPAPWQQHSPWQQPQVQQPGYGQQYYGQQQPYAYAGQQQPQYDAQNGWTTPDAQPAWAAPVGTDQRDPARAGRGRRVLVTGAVAVLIALGAGGVGAATALAFNNNNGSAAVKTSNSSVTRVVDRSSLAQIAAAVQDSVVSITTESGEGSGVILTADGNILTNNHVVATAQGNTVQVIFADGKKATATIVGTDARTDLAVVKASGVSGLKAATLGNSSQMQVGDTVLALGSPLGLEGSVTAGIISAKDRTIQSSSDQQGQQGQSPFGQQQQQSATTTMSGLLQTDAPINPGNSGGALVNTNGEVIGINSAIATSGSNSGNIGLGFAIPSNKAKTVYQALVAGKKVSHPALGVSVTEAEGGGALVSAVTANSAAAKAGLQQGDVIKSVNGKAVNSSDDLVGIIQGANVGDTVTIIFTRSGAQKTVSATLTEAS
jgi:putative serine protease PepD